MASFNVEFKQDLRPCYVDGEKALFHRWEEKENVVFKAKSTAFHNVFFSHLEEVKKIYEQKGIVPNYVDIDKVKTTLAIIEYENGEIAEVDPTMIRFIDDVFKEYCFNDNTNEAGG